MPKSFGNKSFIAPPTAVKLLGDAVDLADLQEATAHMTVMNRMTSRLQQATRRVVLSSGATATLRRAFGQETITLDRSSISSTEDACIPYMESGRLRWDTRTLDISSDITGCNGPCPGTPLTNGAASAALAVNGRALCCEKAPPSAFAGDMPRFIQAVYGSKRTDVQYVGDGRISIAGVTFGHDYTYSSILYRDANDHYWVLTLDRIQSATIQRWRPCDPRFGFETGNDIAYGMAWLKPQGEAISLNCEGALSAAGQTVHYGWHAKKSGTEGHIVLLNGSFNNEYKGPKLCKYELSDSGDAQNNGESWEAYLQRRFSVTFSIVEQHAHTSVGVVMVVPTYSDDAEAAGKLRQETGLNPTVFDPIQAASEAPLYCRYTANDVLEVVRFSQDASDETIIGELDYACDDCVGATEPINGNYAGLVFGDVTCFADTGELGTVSILQGFNYVGSDGDWGNGRAWEDLSSHEQALAFSVPCVPPWTADSCGHAAEFYTRYFKHLTTYWEKFWKKHVLILPEGNHESVLIYELEGTRRGANTGTDAYDTVGSSDWTRITRRLHYFPADGAAQILDEKEHEEGTDYGDIDCLLGVQGGPDELTPLEETELYSDMAVGQYLSLIAFAWPTAIYVDSIADRESYAFHHRNSWLVPDKSIERHDGYDALVDDACFVGKS